MMSETAKTTPTPWEVERHANGCIFITGLHARRGDIADLYHKADDGNIITKDNAWANAALIVTAVNAFEPMKAALEACLELIDDMSRFAGSMALEDYKLFNEAPLKARAALRLAEGEKE
jgi:hypothetical protein